MKINYIILIILSVILFSCRGFKSTRNVKLINLVVSNHWYISGHTLENEVIINSVRKKEGVVKITANNCPKGEIELNVMLTPSVSNSGVPTNLPENSKYVEITYKSSHLIKLQAREGDRSGIGCVHGGSHPRVDLPASPNKFTILKIPWGDFRLDGLLEGEKLNIHNLCKFNFVNYNPVAGSVLEITAIKIKFYLPENSD